MDFNLKFIFLEIFAYLCGSIPFGLIVSKLVNNIDIREHGSHNIGSTNVTRIMGKKYGALVLFLDGMKAILALLVAKYIYGNNQIILSITTIVVVIGHLFPLWLKFKGGKGIACILFSLFVLDVPLGISFLATWILMFFFFKISALSALSAIFVTTLASFFISKIYFLMMIFLMLLTFYKHKSNIKRIINGEEMKFIKK